MNDYFDQVLQSISADVEEEANKRKMDEKAKDRPVDPAPDIQVPPAA